MIEEPQQVSGADLELVRRALALLEPTIWRGEHRYACLKVFVAAHRGRVGEILLQEAERIRPEDFDAFLFAMTAVVKLRDLTDHEIGMLAEHVKEVPDLEHWYNVQELMVEIARRDLHAWLDVVHERFATALRLAEDHAVTPTRRFDPLPHDPADLLPDEDEVEQAQLAGALRVVRDWILEFYPVAWLEVPRLFRTIDASLTPKGRSGLSELGEATLAEWMGTNPDEGDGRLKGGKLWGIGMLLRDYEFTPELLLWLEPLIVKGRRPSREDLTPETRIWGELRAAIGTTGVFWASREHYETRVRQLEEANARARSIEFREFLAPLIAEARRELEAYMLEEADE